jgi:predicted aspartyl protease
MKLKHMLEDAGYSAIKLHKINTNHFEMKVRLNGVKGRFILDTGASNSCVDISLAEKFGLEVEDSETKAAGAGAVGMETKFSKGNRLRIKDWKYKDFNIVLLDLSHVNEALTEHQATAIHGIIGADVLEKGKAIIDYKKKRLYLKRFVFRH